MSPNPTVSSEGTPRARNFLIFWFGQSLSTLGDAFAMIAFPLLILEATGSVVGMGLLTGAFAISQFVVGLFSGVIVDRFDRRRLMIWCDLGRFGLYALIPVVWWLYGPVVWLLYGVAIFGGGLANIFQVSYITAVANLVTKEHLTEANGKLQSSMAVSFVLGPVLAGFLSSQGGPIFAITLDALSFLVSALSLLFIRFRVLPPRDPEKKSSLQELTAGIQFLWKTPVLRWLTILLFGVNFLAAGCVDLFIYQVKHGLQQTDREVGIILGVASVGAIVGALMAPSLRRRFGFSKSWLGSAFFAGFPLILMGIWPTLLALGGFAVLITFGQTVSGINSMSLRQEITPDHLLGRVTAAFWLLINGPIPLGAALGTALAAKIGAPLVLFYVGIGIVMIVAIGLFGPVGSYKEPLRNQG